MNSFRKYLDCLDRRIELDLIEPAFRVADHREPGIIGLLSGVDDTAAVQPSQQVNSKFVTPSAAHFPVAQLPVPIQLERVNDHNWSTRGDTLVSRSPLARPFWSCIVDGLHVHPSAVRLAYRAFPEGCVLITDGQ
jgi:hypothetical protein